MINYMDIIRDNRDYILGKLQGIPLESVNTILSNTLNLLDIYKDNMEELVEACDEERITTIYIPSTLKLTDKTDELALVILEVIKLGANPIKQVEIPKEAVKEVVIEDSLENLISGDTSNRKPPVIVQHPANKQDSTVVEDIEDIDLFGDISEPPTTGNVASDIKEPLPQEQSTEIIVENKNTELEAVPTEVTKEQSKQDKYQGMLDIASFIENQDIKGYLLCTKCTIESSPKARWLDLGLQDINGVSINGKLFGYKGEYKGFAGKAIEIEGKVSSFNGITNLKINTISDENVPYNAESFIKSIDDVQLYVKLAQDLTGMIKDSNTKAMLFSILQKENILALYANRASSVSYHGVLKGDLLKHCVNVVRSALHMVNMNKLDVDIDVIIVGGLLHDVGKIAELPPVGQKEYTLQGMLFGHTFIGANYVYNKCIEFKLDQNKTYNIVHTILAHHSNLELGAVVKPMTIEAEIVSNADLHESKAIHYSEKLQGVAKGEKIKDRECGQLIKL